MITNFTITGADDSIMPDQLFALSKQYPFVEWGILISKTRSTGQGSARFPSMHWIKELVRLNSALILAGKESLNLSMHLCGVYVHEILAGNGDFIEDDLSDIWDAFSRVQINTHGEKHFIAENFTQVLNDHPNKQFIFQYDNVNIRMLELANEDQVNCSALFDLSHGAGILPDQWPEILPNVKCGYAGGLSPENLADQIKGINAIVGDHNVWIDIETHVRTMQGKYFDLTKVRECLSTANLFIHQPSSVG